MGNNTADLVQSGAQLLPTVVGFMPGGGWVSHAVGGAVTLGTSLFQGSTKVTQVDMLAKSMGIPRTRLLALSSVAKEYFESSTVVTDMTSFGVSTAAGAGGTAAGLWLGSTIGGTLGSVVPGVGTGIGMGVGGFIGSVLGGITANVASDMGFSMLCGPDHAAERMRGVMTMAEGIQGQPPRGPTQSEVFIMLAARLPKNRRDMIGEEMKNLKSEDDWKEFIRKHDDEFLHVAKTLLGKKYDPRLTNTEQLTGLIYQGVNPAMFLMDDKNLPILAQQIEDAQREQQGVDVSGDVRPSSQLPAKTKGKNASPDFSNAI